jgi:hypothetical protein
MQVGRVIGAAAIAGHLVVQMKTGLPWLSAGRASGVWVRGPKSLPVGAIASLARAGAGSLPALLTGAKGATGHPKAAWADACVFGHCHS